MSERGGKKCLTVSIIFLVVFMIASLGLCVYILYDHYLSPRRKIQRDNLKILGQHYDGTAFSVDGSCPQAFKCDKKFV